MADDRKMILLVKGGYGKTGGPETLLRTYLECYNQKK